MHLDSPPSQDLPVSVSCPWEYFIEKVNQGSGRRW